MSEVGDSVSSIESAPDLLVGGDKSVELDVKVFVLSVEHANVLLQGFDFGSQVAVSVSHAVVAEAHVVEFATLQSDLFFSISALRVQVVGRLAQVAALHFLQFQTSQQDQALFG